MGISGGEGQWGVLLRTEQAVVPWKNGGGTTRNLWVHPEGADLDGFDWRLSVATIEQDGPFSAFPDVDRELVLLTGGGLALDGLEVTLEEPGQGVRFPGEARVTGRLLNGPTEDLNLMVRRGRFEGAVAVVAIDGPTVLEGWCVALDGAVRTPDRLLERGDLTWGLPLTGVGRVLQVMVRSCRTTAASR